MASKGDSVRNVSVFNLKSLNEVYALAISLAKAFPNPDDVMSGIYELLINAVEHGNLNIGYSCKTILLKEGRWEEEITKRMSERLYSGRNVHIAVEETEQYIKLTITDQGEGFNWRSYLDASPIKESPHGRGLMIALNAGFDSLVFNEAGNQVTCTAKKS